MTVITLSFIAWFALFSLTALLPSYLNPGLSPIVILIIGVIAGVAKYFFKRHYNVQSTYAPASSSTSSTHKGAFLRQKS